MTPYAASLPLDASDCAANPGLNLAGEARPMASIRPVIRLDRLVLPRETSPTPPQDGKVQTLRGVACLLLVAFHAVGSSAASGLHVPDGSAYREFTNLFV